jgi:hypothetical protein
MFREIEMPRLLIWILPAALAIASQPAFAQSGTVPLAPGKAAGIQGAQSSSRLDGVAVAGAVGFVALAVYLIAGTHYHNPGNGSGKSESSKSASGTH